MNIAKNSTVTVTVTATVMVAPEQPVILIASVAAGGSQTELQSADNSASDSDNVGIFADGFD
jgi:hypothetical protein